LHDIGDILTESVPVFRISYHHINAFLKLAENIASVALLDTETNGTTSKVECVFYQAKKSMPVDDEDILGDLL